jgi:hypothetical protein
VRDDEAAAVTVGKVDNRMNEPTQDELDELGQMLGSDEWSPDWMDYWHERQGSACWIKIDYPKLAREAFLGVLVIQAARSGGGRPEDTT